MWPPISTGQPARCGPLRSDGPWPRGYAVACRAARWWVKGAEDQGVGDGFDLGEVSTAEFTDSSDAPAHALQVVGLSWGKLKDAGTVYSADPMEGGQVAGQSSASVAERRTRPGRPTFGNLVDDAPVMVAEPVAKGTATFKTLAGLCATGKHLDKVKITTRSSSHTLHDATIVSVTPADPVDAEQSGRGRELRLIPFEPVDQPQRS